MFSAEASGILPSVKKDDEYAQEHTDGSLNIIVSSNYIL